MTNREILPKLKEISGKTNIQLTDLIQLVETNGVVDMTLSSNRVIENMQSNGAAFEGWILGIKAIMTDWTFRLFWDEPEETNTGHYQRFLYRVTKFESFFGGEKGWFSIAEECLPLLEALRINEGGVYVLNSPSTDSGKRINEGGGKENIIENAIVKNQSQYLKDLFEIDELERQLPVGLFEGKKARNTAIFTGGKSAIDIWGIGGDAMVIFELKAEGNKTVGLLSELFFYAMVSSDEQDGVFSRPGSAGEKIGKTQIMKAMILAPDIHPLITEDVLKLLNEPPNESLHGKIEFGYINMTPKIEFDFNREF